MLIGLIGAGMMGHGMALNLLRHGHRLLVIAHRNRDPVDDLVRRDATEVKSLAGIAQADVILLCVTTAKVVEDTVNGLKPHLRPGQVILDSGTSPPALTERLARE